MTQRAAYRTVAQILVIIIIIIIIIIFCTLWLSAVVSYCPFWRSAIWKTMNTVVIVVLQLGNVNAMITTTIRLRFDGRSTADKGH